MTKDQREHVVAQLNGRTQIEAFEAAKLIWTDSDPKLELALIATLKAGRQAFNRAAAAYAMRLLRTGRTITVLERTVANKFEHPRVRGEAAEALAHGHRKRSHDVLLRGLADPSKDVRFWCAFALGEMAEQRAISVLQRLAVSDRRIVRGFWSVAKEAADALKSIESQKRSRRRSRACAYCVRGFDT